MNELTTKEIIEELRKGMPTFDSTDEECERYIKAYNMSIKILERTKSIDELINKIKAEIEQKCCITVGSENEPAITLYDVFQIIDKYKAESEDKEWQTKKQ